MIFDGKAFASEIEVGVRTRLRQDYGGRRPKIVSVIVGDDPASVLYTKLKKQLAERVGIEFEIYNYQQTNKLTTQLKDTVRKIGEREDVTGVMVQLPIPGLRGEASLQGQALQEVLLAIPLTKDVDGLRWEESGVRPATVLAILTICESIANNQYPITNNQTISNNQKINKFWEKKFVVLGARGAVGRPLVHFLKKRRAKNITKIEWDTPDPARIILAGDVVISCVGKGGIVTGEMVKDGVIAIDVGQPFGDMTQEVYQKASVAVPVPGGVGPVTIACLMENCLDLTDTQR